MRYLHDLFYACIVYSMQTSQEERNEVSKIILWKCIPQKRKVEKYVAGTPFSVHFMSEPGAAGRPSLCIRGQPSAG